MKEALKQLFKLHRTQTEVALVVASGFSRRTRILDEGLDAGLTTVVACLFSLFIRPWWMPLAVLAMLLGLRLHHFLRRERLMGTVNEQVHDLMTRLDEKEHQHGR